MDMDFEELTKKLKRDREVAAKKREELKLQKKNDRRRKLAEYQRERYKRIKNEKGLNKSVLNEDVNEEPTSVTIGPESVANEPNNVTKNPRRVRSVLVKEVTTEPIHVTKEHNKVRSSKKARKPKLSEKDLDEKRKKDRERQRKRRAKLNAQEIEAKKEYDRKYKAQRKAEGMWKYRANMTEREKRKDRKKVNERVRRFREKKRQEKLRNQLFLGENEGNDQTNPRKIQGKRKKNLQRSKVYRCLEKTKEKLKTAQRLSDKYKKRLQRLKSNLASPSPSKKINLLAGGRQIPVAVRRRLRFLETVCDGLEKKKEEIKKSGNKTEMDKFNSFIYSPKMKKHRVLKDAGRILSYKTYRRLARGTKAKSLTKLKPGTISAVKSFYMQDINSRMMPGKKDYITKKKIKKQKRLLLDSVKNLWKKYNAGHANLQVSLSTFRSLRPFWVVFPKLSDRETCACSVCSNINLITRRALFYKLILSNVEELVKESVCNTTNQKCMANQCKRCCNNSLLSLETTDDADTEVSFKQWKTVTKTIQSNGEKTIRVVQKETISTTKREMLINLLNQLTTYKEHIFKIRHQFETLKNVRTTLKSNECFLHIDFSENYVTKCFEEVQSCHFGGSKPQISLHTVVLYTKSKIQSICTVSENTDHRAHCVWAHLKPIFKIIEDLPQIDTLYILSDGPSSQYKNRFNCFFITNIHNFCKNIKFLAWNFSVSGHGKGPADGIGGVVKRTADGRVKNGRDILDVDSFIKEVESQQIKVKLIHVPHYEMESMKKMRPLEIAAIKGISKVQQITWSHFNKDTLYLRYLSCFACNMEEECHHYPLGTVHLNIQPAAENTSNVDLNNSLYQNPDVDDSNDDVHEGTWVVVIYDNDWYPGVVDRRDENFLSVNFMAKSGHQFVWPSAPDTQTVEVSEILCALDKPPHPVSNRHFCFDKATMEAIQSLFESV